MHKDTKEALERLERELLAGEKRRLTDEDLDLLIEDVLFDDEPEEIPATVRTHNTDRTDVDLDGYSDEVYEESREGLGEMIFSGVMLALVAGVMVLWAVSML